MRNFYVFLLLLFPFFTQAQTEISGIINTYTSVSSITSDTCLSQLTVADANTFSIGDAVVLIQMQGATIDESNSSSFGNIVNLNGAGLYEINEIKSIDGQNIFLNNQMVNTYNLGGKVQLVKMADYENATITDTLTAANWNGETGGVLALRVNQLLTMNANIDVSGKGFRGGVAATSTTNNCSALFIQDNYFYNEGNWRGSAKGEGIAPIIIDKEYGRGAQANGGGGGNDHNSGGGGGANVTNGGEGGDNNEPSTFGCKGFRPGIGGKGISTNTNRLFLGGGGGAGHENNNVGTNGGNGGGIVILIANEISPSGNVLQTNGVSPILGGGDGGGGGGGGGTVLLEVQQLNNVLTVIVEGGEGGSIQNFGDRCFGPGGGGSGGKIATNLVSGGLFIPNLSGGVAGLSTNSSDCPVSSNGAQVGMNGVLENMDTLVFAENTFPAPNADFLYSTNNFEVEFFNESMGGISSTWDFGDGNTSMLENPIHIYSENGTYQVSLIVNSSCGADTVTKEVVILIADAQFSVTPAAGCAPLTVNFTDESEGNIFGYAWTFAGGNPSSSLDANPEVTYSTPGLYDVILFVTGPFGFDTIRVEDAVNVVAPAIAEFETDANGAVVNFINNSQNAGAYLWDFGDGSPTEVSQNPFHQYALPGVYEVTLTVSNLYCDSTITQVVNVDFVNTEELERLGIKIFPNPAQDFLQVELKNNNEFTSFKIHGIDGRAHSDLDQTFENNKTIDVSNLPTGVYIITLQNESWKVHHRFIRSN